MISKELLKEIVHYPPFDIHQTDNQIRYKLEVSRDMKHDINIYELAHKCKEWARDKHSIEMYSSLQRNDSPTYWKGPAVATIGNKTWSADIEPKAVFNACEWLLNNQLKA